MRPSSRLCSLLLLLGAAGCTDGVRAPAGRLTAEDVAVLEAVLPHVDSSGGAVLLNREASGALWEREDLPPGIERDLDRRNVVPVLISDSIAEVLGVQLVDSDTLPGPGAWYMPDRAVWRWSVSMPGYSTDGRYALVITAVGCGGGLCGMASGVLLERVRHEWRVVRHVGTLTF